MTFRLTKNTEACGAHVDCTHGGDCEGHLCLRIKDHEGAHMDLACDAHTADFWPLLAECERLRSIVRGVREAHDTHKDNDDSLPEVTARLIIERDTLRERVQRLECENAELRRLVPDPLYGDESD